MVFIFVFYIYFTPLKSSAHLLFRHILNRLKKACWLAGRHAHLPHTAFPSDAYPLERTVISRFFLPGTLKALTPVHRQKHTLEFYSIGTLPAGKISAVGKGWLYTFQPVNRVRGCGGKRERCFWFPGRLSRFFHSQKGTLVPGISGIDFSPPPGFGGDLYAKFVHQYSRHTQGKTSELAPVHSLF